MTALAHCQICARAIKANTGAIAHHGYKRPGSGWQTASCFGAKWAPYEVACDALPMAIEDLRHYIARQTQSLADFIASPPATLQWVRSDAWGKVLQTAELERPEGFSPDCGPNYIGKSYVYQYRRRRFALQSDIANATATLAALTERLNAWKAPT